MVTMILAFVVSAHAMSYDEARERALFLTDKMAYELQLDDRQYDAAYRINLNYLMSLNRRSDVYSSYWRARNRYLQDIFSDLQYRRYAAASYFFRPAYWANNSWLLSVCRRYANPSCLYRYHPHTYDIYCGRRHHSDKYYKDMAHKWKKHQKEVRKEMRREMKERRKFEQRHLYSFDRHPRDMHRHGDMRHWDTSPRNHSSSPLSFPI